MSRREIHGEDASRQRQRAGLHASCSSRIAHRALGTHETAHVLDNAEDGQVHFATKVDFLPDIEESNLLRRCHDDTAVRLAGLEVLCKRDVLVRRARRRVNEKIIKLAPVNILEELFDQICRPSEKGNKPGTFRKKTSDIMIFFNWQGSAHRSFWGHATRQRLWCSSVENPHSLPQYYPLQTVGGAKGMRVKE